MLVALDNFWGGIFAASGAVAGVIVPAMAGLYLLAGLWILGIAMPEISGQHFKRFSMTPFTLKPWREGAIGVMVQGHFAGAFFSIRGGHWYRPPIAHSATRYQRTRAGGVGGHAGTLYRYRLDLQHDGPWCVSLPGEVYTTPNLTGVNLTLAAFSTELAWFPVILTLAVCLFAFSTIVSWYYYGVQAWEYLLGPSLTPIYQTLYISCVFSWGGFQPGSGSHI